MKAILSLCLCVSGLVLSGCEAVFTSQPMGADVVKLDLANWQGTWLGDEAVVVTTVLDAEHGLLQAAWVERSAEGVQFETVTGTVRQSGEWMFFSMQHQQTEEEAAAEEGAGETVGVGEEPVPAPLEYYWGRVENNGRRAVLWWPDLERIRSAVTEGQLPGTVKEDKNVLLGTLDDAQMQLINSPEANLLKWSEPLVFVRIGD